VYQDLGDEFCALEPPAFAGLLATYCRLKGCSIEIVDAPVYNLNSMDVAKLVVENFRPTLVAVVVYGFQPSASTQNMTSAGEICRFIKELDPTVKILMTGTHPAALPRQTMEEEEVDFVCDREGPDTIFSLVQALKSTSCEFDEIPSLWYRDAEGNILSTKPGDLLDDLDAEVPGIAWDLLPVQKYRAHNWHSFPRIHERSPYASIHTSLGCPYKCTFCCINAPFGKPSYRLWHPDSVIKEIDFLVERHGVRHIKFCDEMFVLNKEHVLGICDRLIERKHDVNIWAYARVDTVKDEFLEKLKKAGFNWLCLGIESASKHVRDGALKRYTSEDIYDTVRRIQNAGIYVIGNYIFGLPDDSVASMQNTFDMATELNCEFANFYSAMAYPGSKLYTISVEKGYPLPEKWHHYSQHGYETLPLPTDYCTAAEVLAFRDRAFTTYFTGQRYLDMVRRKFGEPVYEHIKRMTAIPLKRKPRETV
jgi:radical SAM superfamily enzyme YgiQ (UPF0313 family)